MSNSAGYYTTRITNHIHLRNLRGDMFAGLTPAIVLLPLALAFSVGFRL